MQTCKLVRLLVVVSCLGTKPVVTDVWSWTGNPDAENCCSLLGASGWLGRNAGNEAMLCPYFAVDLIGPWLASLPVVVSCLGIRFRDDSVAADAWSWTGNPDAEDCCFLLWRQCCVAVAG